VQDESFVSCLDSSLTTSQDFSEQLEYWSCYQTAGCSYRYANLQWFMQANFNFMVAYDQWVMLDKNEVEK